MSGQAASATPSGTMEIPTAADLARLRADGKPLTGQERKELNAQIKALEEMAQMEDRLRALENRKRSHDAAAESPAPARASSSPRELSPSNQQERHSPTTTSSDSDGSDNSTYAHRHKRRRYSKGIKVTPSYTLRVSSSLREWGDWKRDIERVFEGDPETYRSGSQKIIKALDYLDSNLKSLWYTYSEQKKDKHTKKWPIFLKWTRNNIQHGQNATATLYDQLNDARQLQHKSPIQFNAYLAAIERDLPQQPEATSAMTFYSKLTKELKKQFQTSDITIPETRAECVAVAQRIWEGLHGSDERRGFTDTTNKPGPPGPPGPGTGPRYPRIGSERDRKDRYHQDHRSRDDRNRDRPRNELMVRKPEKELICYQCNKPGHYATKCPDRRERKEAKIQAVQQEYDLSPVASIQPSRSGSEMPQTIDEPEDSDDSLN
jgi:hypothetical protein